jgi:uncharacterized protein YndB with AHSA1/START domain
MNTDPIIIQTVVKAPMEVVWKCWNEPAHIEQWAFASPDWQATNSSNDLRVGGTFSTTMSARDGSASFEFGGVYTAVEESAVIEYDLGDKRHVKIVFEQTPDGVKVTETFDPEQENSREMQQSGWQAILDNFKKHTESI